MSLHRIINVILFKYNQKTVSEVENIYATDSSVLTVEETASTNPYLWEKKITDKSKTQSKRTIYQITNQSPSKTNKITRCSKYSTLLTQTWKKITSKMPKFEKLSETIGP